MRSQHKQNRRPRGSKPQDDEQYGPPRMDESSESYSRSHRTSHRSDDRRTSSTSNREYYDGYRDLGSHSRSRRDDDPWYSDSGRFREEDVYRRENDYDTGIRRDSDWGTRPTGDPSYGGVREEWPPPQHYDHPSSYHDSSAWSTAAPRDAYDSRSSYYEDWSTTGARASSSLARDDERHLRHDDKYGREDLGWSRDHRREKGSQQQSRFQNDSGWDVRRRENGWDDRAVEESQAMEDRAWEPAPSWQSTHRTDSNSQPRNQNQNNAHRTSQQKNQQYSKGKRTHNSKQQRRDWRNDDSNLNNWTRRDFHNQNRKQNKTQQQQQQPQQRSGSHQRQKLYHSPSRSRSPAESYHSRISSRGRSRTGSRSPAPKRRRRESDHLPRSQTPSDRDAPGWVPRQDRSIYSRSPSPNHDFRPSRSRRKSVSSVSSATSGRTSRSNSPNQSARPVHRLPTSESSIPMDLDSGPRHSRRRQPSSQTNGKHRSHDGSDKAADVDWVPNSSVVESHYTDPMPPPAIIPSSRSSYPSTDIPTVTEIPQTRVNISSKLNRVQPSGSKSNVRTQPTPSSSLRKFFPGDDEDSEQQAVAETPPQVPPPVVPQRKTHRTPSAQVQVPTGKGVWPPPEEITEPQAQKASWPPQEQPAATRVEPAHNGQHVVKQPSQPQPVATTWDGGGLIHQAPTPMQTPPTSTLKEKPRKAPHPKPPATSIPTMTSSPPYRSNSPPLVPISSTFFSMPMTSVASFREAPRLESGKGPKAFYNILAQVGEGTFGKVYKARNSATGILVALKRIRMETEKEGFPVTAMREVKLLQSLRHENVVQLYEMIVSNGSVYMVFEYNHHDLTGILSQTQFEFTAAHLKSLCHQMLAGLAYLHHKGVIHRDIKGSNILINNHGELKLADFGLARFYQKRRRTDYTNRVITLWYRPPELLFGATVYGPEVDMWSAGCIMLELFTKKPVFQGNDEIHQLEVIHRILGTPTIERWPTLVDLPWYELAKPRDEIPNRFRDIFQKWMSPAALDLAEQLLAYDPLRRLSALQAMEAPYFTQEAPAAQLPEGLAGLEGEWHELETKRERAKKRKKNEGSA
ncbi:hypothetical protein NP233_g578 [Leucocoprinus birnbaumii]|uniref:Protein kinase domain-containing protein n=1 Tax=Leucocoprinus birnbaumii TaxID=56174 RepID=A0AAD5W3U1_9AGAR|nr:hypothetical protein NP233_g578 [Leucocoprinus birnbaumii]